MVYASLMLTSTCSRCRTAKPLSEFAKSANRKDGVYHYCKTCSSEYRKAAHQARPHMERNRKLRKYGLGDGGYDALLLKQGGVCAICGQPETYVHPRTGALSPLAVDHNHETGAVRALLCRHCNTGIGSFNEDPWRLRAAADYLEEHR